MIDSYHLVLCTENIHQELDFYGRISALAIAEFGNNKFDEVLVLNDSL